MKKKILLLGMVCCSLLTYSQWLPLGNWDQLVGVEDHMSFGYDVDLSADGSIMAVGSPVYSSLVGNNIDILSMAQVFQYMDGDWVQLGSNIIGQERMDNNILPRAGYEVDLSADGTVLAVGEPDYRISGDEWDLPSQSLGRVRVFRYQSGEWVQIGTDLEGDRGGFPVTSNEVLTDGYFGSALSLSDDGNRIIIGDLSNEVNGFRSGQVRVYENINDVWTQIGTEISGDEYSFLGNTVSISGNGNIIAVGAPEIDIDETFNGTNVGRVTIYRYENNDWMQVGDSFYGSRNGQRLGGQNNGISLSYLGDIVAIGSPRGVDYGKVMIYENNNDQWESKGNDVIGTWLQLGMSLDLTADGLTMVAGAPLAAGGYGEIYVYTFINNDWELVNNAIPNAVGGGLFAYSTSISDDGAIVASGAQMAPYGDWTQPGRVVVYQECANLELEVIAETLYTVCSGDIATLSASIQPDLYMANGTINWYDSADAEEPIFTGAYFETEGLTENTSYWVDGESGSGCKTGKIEIHIEVEDKRNPIVAFNYSDICTIETLVLPVLADGFSAGGEFHTTSSLVVDPVTGAIDATGTMPGTYTVTYEIEENQEECIASGRYQGQVVVQTCTIQRGISPNNDGLNDVFDLTGYNVKKLSIYNRYGKEIYSKTNYTNQWEGQDNKGNALPTGTYFYSIDKNNDEQLTGWVYINREL